MSRVCDKAVFLYHLLKAASVVTSESFARVASTARSRSVASKRSKLE